MLKRLKAAKAYTTKIKNACMPALDDYEINHLTIGIKEIPKRGYEVLEINIYGKLLEEGIAYEQSGKTGLPFLEEAKTNIKEKIKQIMVLNKTEVVVSPNIYLTLI